MNNELLLYSIVLFPVAGAFLLPFAGKYSETFRNWLALALISISCVFSALLVPTVLAGNSVMIRHNMPFGMNIVLHADGLAVFMALISSFIGAIIVLYSFGYISHYDNRNEYYCMVILFLGSMMGLVYSGNLILMYIFWEITAVASWRLIGFFRGKQDVAARGQSLSDHGVRRAGHAARVSDPIPAGRLIRPGGDQHRAAPHPGFQCRRRLDPARHPLQISDAAAAHLAAGCRRGAVAGDGIAACRRAGENRRLRLCAFIHRHRASSRGLDGDRPGDCRDQRAHFGGRCADRDGYQTHHRLFHGEPDRLHLSRTRRRQSYRHRRRRCSIY